MDPVYYHGKNSLFESDGTVVHSKGWSVNPSVAEEDITNTSDEGYTDVLALNKSLSVTVEFHWDAQTNILDDPISLHEGSVVTNLKLYLDGPSSPFWLLPKGLVTETPQESKVDGAGKITLTIKNKGKYFRPTGTFTPSDS